MVSGIVGEILVQVTFTLSNGTTFTLNNNSSINTTNFVSSLKIKEALSAENDIPIGVNTSNILDLEIISNNKALIPENTNSTYYGYMNNSAIIEIYITENNEQIYFGKYFVNTWKSSISSDSPNLVKISATNIMSIISKQAVPDVEINTGMYIKNYLLNVIDKLNDELPQTKQIEYDEEDINFDAFPVMQFSNLDTENMGNCLNGLSQCTMTNIFVDREGNLKTDYCCDDNPAEAVYSFDVMTSASAGDGVLVKYDSIKVNYSLGNILDVEQLASLYQQDCIAGDNLFNNISLGEAVYKINRIEVVAEDPSIFVGVKSALYNKNKMQVTIEADAATKVDIKIYGQRLDTTNLVYETDGENKLEITNRVIEQSYVEKYANNMLQLINFKNNSMSVDGYFNPRVKLSDTVFINCTNAMSISGYYKVVGLDWDLSMYGKCVMSLIKTFEVDYDLDVIMNNLNNLLELTINGVYSKDSRFVSLDSSENAYANAELDTELTDLRELLYGE